MLFVTKTVTVKLLPFDNKSELGSLGPARRRDPGGHRTSAGRSRQSGQDRAEVTSVDAYVGTAAPFNFNGLVRHYYLRRGRRSANCRSNLQPKGDRSRTSHEIALDVRENLRT